VSDEPKAREGKKRPITDRGRRWKGEERENELIRSKDPFEVGFRLLDRALTYLVCYHPPTRNTPIKERKEERIGRSALDREGAKKGKERREEAKRGEGREGQG
jgi:hypothetical protein